MLESINMLIGFTVVMLMFSLAVTSIVQMIVVVLQLRGRNLRRGIITLLRQIDPGLEASVAHTIATTVVKHPLVARIPGQLGSVVQREELIEILLGLAAGTEPIELDNCARDRLAASIRTRGIANPAGILRDARATAMRLEVECPDLSANARRAASLVQEGSSEFVAAVTTWFDGTIDRVGELFTANVRVVTAVVVLALVAFVQLDALDLLNRLAIDKDLRAALVRQGEAMAAASDTSAHAAALPESTLVSSPLPAGGSPLRSLRQLAASQLITLPGGASGHPGAGWWRAWRSSLPGHIPGIALSAILLGFGAPFWFNSLKYLLSLRSSFSAKEDRERRERAAPGASSPVDTSVRPNEAADLGPVG